MNCQKSSNFRKKRQKKIPAPQPTHIYKPNTTSMYGIFPSVSLG